MAYSTKPDRKGLIEVTASCDCGWTNDTRGAQVVAANHHAKCGQRTMCATTFVLVWDAVPERKQP